MYNNNLKVHVGINSADLVSSASRQLALTRQLDSDIVTVNSLYAGIPSLNALY